MRAEPSEKSEMTSQLLFGEYFSVVEQTEKWLLIRSCIDDYQGWVSSNMVNELPDDFPTTDTPHVIRSPYVLCAVAGKRIHLPGGSLFWTMSDYLTSDVGQSEIKQSFRLAGEQYSFCGGMTQPESGGIAAFARQYLGAPYLWGGKTIFGIDCSGLVQVACRMDGFWLPRDASQQSSTGCEITYNIAAANDVAFFCDDNGKIVHTGILCNANSIIHASGSVRIDRFDEQGIFCEADNRYTHRLHSIKRMKRELPCDSKLTINNSRFLPHLLQLPPHQKLW